MLIMAEGVGGAAVEEEDEDVLALWSAECSPLSPAAASGAPGPAVVGVEAAVSFADSFMATSFADE